jgi:hypothetical protein
MQILLDTQSVAIYFGGFTVLPDCVQVGDAFNWSYNTSNTSVIDVDPPSTPLPHAWKWENGAWTCIDQPTVDTFLQAQKDAFNATQKQRRVEAYQKESDPLFFMAQRGEGTMEEWQAKIEQIKTRYPYQS